MFLKSPEQIAIAASLQHLRLRASVERHLCRARNYLSRTDADGDPRGDQDLDRFAEKIRQTLFSCSAQELKKNDLLRVTTAADVHIVAEMDGILGGSGAAKPAEPASADDNFAHISAYMEAPSVA